MSISQTIPEFWLQRVNAWQQLLHLIESAKANGLEPFEYICYVLEDLPYADTVEKLEALLPWNVKAVFES